MNFKNPTLAFETDEEEAHNYSCPLHSLIIRAGIFINFCRALKPQPLFAEIIFKLKLTGMVAQPTHIRQHTAERAYYYPYPKWKIRSTVQLSITVASNGLRNVNLIMLNC